MEEKGQFLITDNFQVRDVDRVKKIENRHWNTRVIIFAGKIY